MIKTLDFVMKIWYTLNMMFIGHKILVNKRQIAYDFANRHDKYRTTRRQRIKTCIASIRRLQNNPTDKDKYDNPAYHT